ncbi:single-stranded DNA-binding protein [Neolewinella antarctica]|uniref:Single-stranded DNA-binding protein n=1 Tax=Neolewinella antarctica TaxID=442734 RepID=A0ABX0XF15_9BACT|nr:single-stranded DNA-binding protein [Neolewinella antarctica]NJC27900.1 single-strand DNA-binding protein [Neolewinella antarctica]
MVNKITLIGRLGADPEIRTLESGVAVGKFGLATSENYKDRSGEWQEQTEWHDVVVWRQAAERAQRSLTKGCMVYVEGKLTHRKWQDKEGNNRKTTEVVANYFRVLNNPNKSDDNRPSSGEPDNYAPADLQTTTTTTPASQPTAASSEPAPTGGGGKNFDDEEDLPF